MRIALISDIHANFTALESALNAIRALDGSRPRVLATGHSHIPFTRLSGGVRVINCGTIGYPIDGDPRGSFALLTIDDDQKLRVEIRRFEYRGEQVLRDLELRRAPRYEKQIYVTGAKQCAHKDRK